MKLIFCCCFFYFFGQCFTKSSPNSTISKTFEGIPKQFKCKIYDVDLIENFTCSYKKLGWKKAKYNIDVYVQENKQIDNLILKGTVFRRESNMEYRVFGPKEITIDFCAFLRGSWSHLVVDMTTNYMKRASRENNMFQACPLSGHVYLHDLIVDENAYSVVKFIPEGSFVFRTRVFTNISNEEQFLLEIKTYVDIQQVGISP